MTTILEILAVVLIACGGFTINLTVGLFLTGGLVGLIAFALEWIKAKTPVVEPDQPAGDE